MVGLGVDRFSSASQWLLLRHAARVWRRVPASWGIVAAALIVSIAGTPLSAALARLFFVVVMLGGLVATLGRLSASVATFTATAALVLVSVQRLPVRPVVDPPSSQWTQPLQGPDQVVRHVIQLPVGQGQWSELWHRAAGAAVWICARGPLVPSDGLQLVVNGQLLATITEEAAAGPRPQPTSIGFYRVPVERTLLERSRPATFELRRAAGADGRPIDICGTFTYRPTAGIESSTFFDGVVWSSPGPSRQGRFVIELRFENAAGQIFAAFY